MHLPSLSSTASLLLLLSTSSSYFANAAALPPHFANADKSSATSPTAKLIACLKPLGSKVLTSSSSKYNQERYGFDLRYTYLPQVIVMAASTSDVQTATKCATSSNVAVAPRSGGHSFMGYSIGGQDGSLVIDLGGLTSVSVTSSGVATVGAGIRLGALYLDLYNQGGWTLNAGTCPSVGIGGHALGGGFGLLGRRNGLLIDSIKEMQLVNANGELLTVSATSNSDLFYALRGAGGGSYGVVTQFTFQAIQPASTVTSYTYDWDLKDYEGVLTAYVNFQQTADVNVGVEMNIGPDGLEMYGLYEGSKADQTKALAPFLAKAPKPKASDIRVGRHIDAQLRFAYLAEDTTDINALALTGKYKAGDSRYTKGKSLVYPSVLKKSTIDLLGKWAAVNPKGSTANYIIVDIWGGVIPQVSESATAFIHRDAHTVFEFVSEWNEDPNAKPGIKDCQACLTWMNDMYAEFLTDFTANYGPVRGYQNYIDSEIPDWQDAYYGDAITRLKQIKAATDPNNTFRFPQSIPLA
jgi:FAD/FMN-containing dehydrogenase